MRIGLGPLLIFLFVCSFFFHCVVISFLCKFIYFRQKLLVVLPFLKTIENLRYLTNLNDHD